MRQPYLVTDTRALLPGVEQVTPDQAGRLPVDQPACWMIEMRNWQTGWKTVCDLRNHKAPKVYLRPLIFFNPPGDIPEDIRMAADAQVSEDGPASKQFRSLLSRVEPVNIWIDNLPDADGEVDVNTSFKVLRLLASRNREQLPLRSIRRKSGFVYPIIEPLFPVRDTGALDTLAFLHEQRLLSGRFIDRAHFCGHCDSAFLNFKETCPHCGSDDIRSNELIHHFKCAYVGESSEFRGDGDMVCPKCDHTLKHIGVDYDKPSVIHRCNQCTHQFQNPVTITGCYNCGQSSQPENQTKRDIQAYSVSAIGKNAAMFGMEALFIRFLKTEIQLQSFETFTALMQIEKARIARYREPPSTLLLIHLKDISQLYARIGRRAKEIFSELSAAFKATVRESDLITSRNESIFLVLMTHTDEKSAQHAAARLELRINDLLENNLQFKSEMFTEARAIEKDTDLNGMLERFLRQHAD